ncbi:B-cell receptor CD22-like, partial [Dicentrarchus labrax]|uniref:B-cell receptor CD22-like n=1 Tax=Dicentrarchus labrax TaxID=13489 RepID=UPI0021F5B3A2
MQPEHSNKYYLRVQCDNGLKYDFFEQKLDISVKAWVTVRETLEENQDKTKVKTSVVNFTASHLHHRQEISCTAVYNKQDGSTESSVSTSLTADISYSPKHTTVSVSPSGPVPEDSTVTLTCSSTANPAVRNYTWYRADGGQETFIGTGRVLNIKASEVSGPFFCKAENDLGAGRSNISQIDVLYLPKHTTVSVSPSGPVPEDSTVTLTCSSTANPAVRTYTWYRADGGQETFIGTGRVLNIKASEVSGPFFCKVENDLGAGRSNISQIDVQFAPQILFSSYCTKTTDQLNCSCETVGNPSPTLQWYLDGLPFNHSDTFAISNEPLNETGLRIIITVNQPQWRNLSTLLCRSSNSLGSATQRFYFYSLEPQTSAQYQVTLTVFIIIVVALLVLVCALLLVNRAQKTRHNLPKGTVAMSQLLTSGEGNEVPNTTEDDISINASVLRQEDVAPPAAVSGPNNADSASSGPNNAEGADKNLEKKNEGGSDVVLRECELEEQEQEEEEGSLGHSQETLEENQDKTKVKTSVVNFTASHLHHRQEISCTAVYNKQDGSTESS